MKEKKKYFILNISIFSQLHLQIWRCGAVSARFAPFEELRD